MKIRRNALCPCGSGKKYKNCCIYATFPKRNIITLDACICRSLIREKESSWYDDFCVMCKHGIQFCIADICSVELTNQFLRGSINTDDWRSMMGKLKMFISSDFPILPGKKQLFQLIGTRDKTLDHEEKLDINFEMAFSNAMFNLMSNLHHLRDSDAIFFMHDTQKYKCQISDITSKCYNALQKERDDWTNHIKDISKNFTMPLEDIIQEIKFNQDESFENEIPLSYRLDLLIKFLIEKLYLASSPKTPYDPCSRRSKNDGIDFTALFSIILPSRFCTIDHMRDRINNIDSFQKSWVVTPGEVVNLYKTGQLHRLQWNYTSQ